MIKRLLITGGTGFLGGHLLLRALQNWDVYAVYRGKPVDVPGVAWLKADLRNPEEIAGVFEAVKPVGLIHAAAMSDIDECQARLEEARLVNTEAAGLLAGFCRLSGCRMVFVSTDMVFDGEGGMYREQDATGPVNLYGETKVAAEHAVAAECPSAVCARTALIYGVPAFGGRSFTHAMSTRLSKGEPVTLFYDQFRTPILVQNLADALLELAASDFAGLLHLGGGERISRYDFGLLAASAKGFSADLIRPGRMNDPQPAAKRPADVSLDSSKASGVLSTRLIGCGEGVKFL
jgi:dTDP-4-dehydrorhamnose reductase